MFYILFVDHCLSTCRCDHWDKRGWYQSAHLGWLLVNANSVLHYIRHWNTNHYFLSSLYAWTRDSDQYARVNYDCYHSVSIELRVQLSNPFKAKIICPCQNGSNVLVFIVHVLFIPWHEWFITWLNVTFQSTFPNQWTTPQNTLAMYLWCCI